MTKLPDNYFILVALGLYETAQIMYFEEAKRDSIMKGFMVFAKEMIDG